MERLKVFHKPVGRQVHHTHNVINLNGFHFHNLCLKGLQNCHTNIDTGVMCYSPFTLESGFTCTPRVAVLVVGGDSLCLVSAKLATVASALSDMTCIAL